MADGDFDATGRGDYRRKIVSRERLVTLAAEARRGGRTVVHCHGCFDIVHPGHIRYLQFARTQGDLLVVSITGDAQIDKGEQRPYIPQELRAENLAALSLVDAVVIDDEATACRLIAALRPDVYVKGQEYATSNHPGFLAERAAVEAAGGRVVFSSGDVVFSSTRLLETRGGARCEEQQRLALVCRRHGMCGDALTDLVASMQRRRVLVVGDAAVDAYVLCEADSIADEAPMMSLRALDRQCWPGDAAAVARHAAGLGASVMLVTSLGGDRRGTWLRESLGSAGVNLSVVAERAATPLRTRYLVDEQKLSRVDEVEVRPLDSHGERHAVEIILDEARIADVVILADSGLGTITPGLLQGLGKVFHERCANLVTGVCDRRADLLALRYASLMVCSERRLRATSRDAAAGLSALAYRALEQTQSLRLLVTLGKRGLVAFDRPTHDASAPEWSGRLRSEHLPSLSAAGRDGLGCREAMLAASGLALSGGANLMQTAYLASAAAAIELSRTGHPALTATELLDWMGQRDELYDAEPDGPRADAPAAAAAE
ncbi:MAG: PfkB family carbohydrate kinase [Phycisphaerae bacterium]